ncbi:hypothetical protein Tco_0138875 [Tanacetum coccineum]
MNRFAILWNPEIHIDEKLNFIEEPVEIMDREVKRLKQSRIPIVKVHWNSRRGPEYTWEREDQMQKKYPHLFANPLEQETSKKQKIDIEDASITKGKDEVVKEEEIEVPVKKTGMRRKQKARKGINVDKTAQDELNKEINTTYRSI